MEYLLATVITGTLTLIGTVVTCFSASRKTDNNIKLNQAVFDTKIDELTREVREHNGFATRIPVLESEIKALEGRMLSLEKALRRREGK